MVDGNGGDEVAGDDGGCNGIDNTDNGNGDIGGNDWSNGDSGGMLMIDYDRTKNTYVLPKI